MSRKEKLLKRFLTNPPASDFRWDELETLMGHLGFKLEETTGGSSHKTFIIDAYPDRVIYTYRPHPDGILKAYQVREIRKQLRVWGMIEYE
ncbi:MAG: type II toxin-antitoxin system HicA family toxin [Rubrivivax sp.]|nr:type II toxin-antitoxin system HicA family toxin [Rubrivivax sp.]